MGAELSGMGCQQRWLAFSWTSLLEGQRCGTTGEEKAVGSSW